MLRIIQIIIIIIFIILVDLFISVTTSSYIFLVIQEPISLRHYYSIKKYDFNKLYNIKTFPFEVCNVIKFSNCKNNLNITYYCNIDIIYEG